MRSTFRPVFLVCSLVLLPPAAWAQTNPEARAADAVGFDIEWNHVALSVPDIAESI